MGCRETMNRYSGVVAGTVAVAILIAGYSIVRQVSGGNSARVASAAYFTVDDGKTYFKDDINKIPPFQSDGKEAVRARVFSCNGKEFVAFLEKYTPEYMVELDMALAAAKEGVKPPNTSKLTQLGMTGRLIKKVGNKNWYSAISPEAAQILNVKCPDGSLPDPVSP